MLTKRLSAADVEEAALFLKRGELVAFPTETVYGLGASIYLEEAVKNIFSVKGRPPDNPLIAHISSTQQAAQLAASIPVKAQLLMDAFFPGPLTLVLKKSKDIPSIVSGGGDTIAFRMPAHPLAQKLIAAVGSPLVAPSANLSGTPSSTTAEHVLSDFEGKIAAILDGGACEIGIESTVVALLDGSAHLLRPGIISKEEIEKVLSCTLSAPSNTKPLSPGMKYRHYSPKAKVLIFHSATQLEEHIAQNTACRHIFKPTMHNIYAELRAADKQQCSEVCILCDEGTRQNLGLMNRLFHAAKRMEH